MSEARTKRRKRSAGEARDEGLAAARTLLLAQGPGAVTLANVGRATGMSHSNVIHHFGSASGLQAALMEAMIRDLDGALGDAVGSLGVDAEAPALLVGRVFDAFDHGGAAQLAAWLVLAQEPGHLESLGGAVRDLVDAVRARVTPGEGSDQRIRAGVLLIAVCAFGDALIGPPLRRMLGQEDAAMRTLLAQLLPALIAPPR
ncbi:TetR/AcrR family transcriptional regulator [Sphingomonas sp. CJ20]